MLPAIRITVIMKFLVEVEQTKTVTTTFTRTITRQVTAKDEDDACEKAEEQMENYDGENCPDTIPKGWQMESAWAEQDEETDLTSEVQCASEDE